MVIDDVYRFMPSPETAADYLVATRWHGEIRCPYCRAIDIIRHKSHDRKIFRWHCRNCQRPFSATVGTFLEGTRIDLRHWYIVILITSRNGQQQGAYRIAKDIGRRRATISRMLKIIREAISAGESDADLISAIVDGNPREILQ